MVEQSQSQQTTTSTLVIAAATGVNNLTNSSLLLTTSLDRNLDWNTLTLLSWNKTARLFRHLLAVFSNNDNN